MVSFDKIALTILKIYDFKVEIFHAKLGQTPAISEQISQ